MGLILNMNNKVPAFGQRRAGVYLLSEIYNPDDTSSSVQNINKVIPAIGSIVVDDTVGEHNTLYVVYSVDAVTHKSTLVNIALNKEDEVDDLRMLFYNPVATTYYYPTTDTTVQQGVTYYTLSDDEYRVFEGSAFVSGTTYYEKKELHELHIDDRVSVYTSLATSYTIYHAASMSGVSSSTEVVSQYYVAEDPYGESSFVEDTEIPMDRITIPASTPYGEDTVTDAYRPRVCYCTEPLISGDKYLVIVKQDSHVISQFTLTGHSMSHLADLNNARKTIVSISVGGNQYNASENYFYITQDQRLDQLTFYLTINYTDGSEVVAIDNVNAFMYTEENVATISANSESPIIFKYFPAPSENLGMGSGTGYTISPTGRYITLESKIKTIATAFSTVSRLVPIFAYDPSTSRYLIKPVCYMNDLSAPVTVTNTNAVTGYNNGTTASEQSITLTYQFENNGIVSSYTNSYRIRLYPTADAASTGVYYYFRFSGAGDVTFGKDPRPALIQVSGNNYKFKISEESGTYNTKDNFLKNYYYNAYPPTPYNASNPDQPTYFRIRKVEAGSGSVSISNNIAFGPNSIDSFFEQEPENQIITASTTLHSTAAVPATALLEFLTKNNDDSYNVLFGVPIDVIKA